jgi:16S rRNA (guanine527-N7)-methyltransferase
MTTSPAPPALLAEPWRLLIDGAAQLGAPLRDDQVQNFQRYTELLLAANQQFNLTAVRDSPGMVAKLHLDSLSLLGPIAKAAGLDIAGLRQSGWRAADVGSGAGIPGIPLLLAWPSLRLSLIESIQKKGVFLRQTLAALNKSGLVLIERAEIVGQEPSHRGGYDLVVARAVAEMSTLAELTIPLARVGGLVILPKGAKAGAECAAAGYAIQLLGAEVVGVEVLTVPGVEESRAAIILRKIRPTPPAYPRRPGLPAKRPLTG